MIAAAFAALAGVTFAECEVGVPCAYAYRVKLAGKTVTGKAKTTGSASHCDLEKTGNVGCLVPAAYKGDAPAPISAD